EEVAANVFVDGIHLYLQGVEKLVEAVGQNRVYLRKIQFGTEQPQALLASARESPRRHARNGVPRLIGQPDAVAQGAGELAIQQQKLHDAVGRNTAVTLAVHFESA